MAESSDSTVADTGNEAVARTITVAPGTIDAHEAGLVPEKTEAAPAKPSADELLALVSENLSSNNAQGNLGKIEDTLKQLEGFPEVMARNPFFWYAKGLAAQSQGDLKAAAGFMAEASALAPNNRDIALWKKTFDTAEEIKRAQSIKLDDLGLAGGSINFYEGTMWVDERNLLVTVERGSGSEARQFLKLLDVNTLQSRQVYEGEYIGLDSVTPDGRYVILYDKGLKLVALETGESLTINEKGLYADLSPDGRRLAYCADGLWVYDIDTGLNTRLDDGRDNSSPLWFPDGKSILFVGDLGGRELGGGAGHLQSIFRISAHPDGKKERIDESWEGKFHYIEWILAGEVFHAEEGWDDGFNSVAYNLYTGFKNRLGSMNDGESLSYRHDDAGYLYVTDGRGGITLMDPDGKVQSRYEYGNIWGSSFGFPVKGVQPLQGGDGLLLYYSAPLENVMHVYKFNEELEDPSLIADIPRESPSKAILDRTASRAVFAISAAELLVMDLK